MDDPQNSSKPVIVNDLDLILGSELDDYRHMHKTGKKGEKMATVVDFDSLLFDENGEVKGGKVAKDLADEDVDEENEEVLDSDLDTPSACSPTSPPEWDSIGNTEWVDVTTYVVQFIGSK